MSLSYFYVPNTKKSLSKLSPLKCHLIFFSHYLSTVRPKLHVPKYLSVVLSKLNTDGKLPPCNHLEFCEYVETNEKKRAGSKFTN